MANAPLTPAEQREADAQRKVSEALADLYGDEKKLIVLNKTEGVVSIGFGDLGDHGGFSIPRSRLPVVLTNHYALDTWKNSSDFRRAVTKRWLEVISQEHADKLFDADRAHQARLRAAAGDNQGYQPADVSISPANADRINDPMVIDEETAQLRPASEDANVRKFMQYEGMIDEVQAPPVNAPQASVLSASINSRAIAVVESLRRGQIQPLDAIRQIDADEKLFTNSDLYWIADNATIASVSNYVGQVIAQRRDAKTA